MPKTYVLRFMGTLEALKLLQNQPIENTTNHREQGFASDSIGACFLPVEGLYPLREIYEAAKFLSGITDLEVCLYGRLMHPERFTKSVGRYAIGRVEELSTERYELSDFFKWSFYAPPPASSDVMKWGRSSVDWTEPRLAITDREWPYA